jgi:hypothetical protein
LVEVPSSFRDRDARSGRSSAVLTRLDPPLNIEAMRATAVRRQLSLLHDALTCGNDEILYGRRSPR